jgi:hypothetical protein
MAFGQNSRSGLSYVTEVTFGTTPGTPSLIQLPYNSHSLNLTKETLEGNEIRPDRMQRVFRHGNRQVGGDITGDLRMADFDPFLESAMLGAWSTNVLKNGITPKFFSIEDEADDINQYRLFTGMTVNTLAVSIKPNQMVTATFGMIGKNMTISGSTVDAVKTAPSTNQPFDSYSGFLKIDDAGGTPAAIATVTGVDFTVTNDFAPTFVIGSSTTPELQYGMAKIEGTMTAYFDDASLVNRFLNETETALEIEVDDPTGSNEYQFLFPRLKFTAGDVSVPNGTGAREVSLPFRAYYDTAENTILKITRST